MANIVSETNHVNINQIIWYAENFPNLSRRELANTICENLDWTTPTGSLKVNSCLSLLSNLENVKPEKTKRKSNRKTKILAKICKRMGS